LVLDMVFKQTGEETKIKHCPEHLINT